MFHGRVMGFSGLTKVFQRVPKVSKWIQRRVPTDFSGSQSCSMAVSEVSRGFKGVPLGFRNVSEEFRDFKGFQGRSMAFLGVSGGPCGVQGCFRVSQHFRSFRDHSSGLQEVSEAFQTISGASRDVSGCSSVLQRISGTFKGVSGVSVSFRRFQQFQRFYNPKAYFANCLF